MKWLLLILSFNGFAQGLIVDPYKFAAAATPAMTYTDLASFNNTANQTSYATGAYQPAVNSLVVAVVVNSKAAAADSPTFSGNGLTWVAMTNQTFFGNTIKITMFRAMGAAPTSTAGTADFAGATQTGCHIRVIQFANADTSGANGSGAIVQTVATNAATTANAYLSMASLTGTQNAVLMALAHNQVSGTLAGSPEAGWTSPWSVSYATPFCGLFGEYRLATTDNSITITSASVDYGIIALEIKQAP